MFGDPGKIISQMGNIKTRMKEMESELRDLRIRGESRNRMIFIEINGKMEVLEVKVKPEALSTLSPLAMEAAIEEALETALTQATQAVQQKMQAITGGLNLPGMF